MQPTLTIHPLAKFPLVQAGDDLASLISDSLCCSKMSLCEGDVVVVAQKIVSLSEGRLMRLSDVSVSAAARRLAAETGKDPRVVELILRESSAIIRKKRGLIIARNRLGVVGANAGIDQSNIDHSSGECALLLPEDPDQSAQSLRESLLRSSGSRVGIIISDSMNRPWRHGTIGTAIGCAGITVLDDRRGQPDLYGREMHATVSNRADAIAAAAVLVMGESTESVPVAVVRGLPAEESAQVARDCIRPVSEDLFLQL